MVDLTDIRTVICAECGYKHERGCAAHLHGVVPLTPCRRIPALGSRACQVHGGGLKVVRKAAAQRNATAIIQKRFNPTYVSPERALLDLVQYQSGVVEYWRSRVEQLRDEELEWSRKGLKSVDGMTPAGITDTVENTEGAGPHIAYTLLQEAQRDLSRFATDALHSGIEERQVQIAEQQGAVFAQVQRVILQRMFDAMLTAALAQAPDLNTRAIARAWEQATSQVVPQELRSLASRMEKA